MRDDKGRYLPETAFRCGHPKSGDNVLHQRRSRDGGSYTECRTCKNERARRTRHQHHVNYVPNCYECQREKERRTIRHQVVRAEMPKHEPTPEYLEELERVKAKRAAWWAEHRPALQRRINLPWTVKELVSYMPRAS